VYKLAVSPSDFYQKLFKFYVLKFEGALVEPAWLADRGI